MHDDLVMAVALAVSAAVRDTPSLLPGVPASPKPKPEVPVTATSPTASSKTFPR